MENASKALIITGAVLISILVISLGLAGYYLAKEQNDSSNMDKQTIQAFNSEWESYIGSNKTASQIKAMYSAVIANNAAETKSGAQKFVKIKGAQPQTIPAIDSNTTYTVTATYENGLITDLSY